MAGKKKSWVWRLFKWFGIAAVSLAILFVVGVGPWPVNRSSLEDSKHFKATLASIEQSLSNPASVSGLEAGLASVEIALPAGLPLAGYGARKKAVSTGTHDPIRAKALAISAGGEKAVVVGADILLINPTLADEVRSRISSLVPQDDVYFVATHTHSGPGGWGTWWAEHLIAGEPSPEGKEALAAGMADAVEKAFANIESATLSYGKANVPEFIRNRLRKDPDAVVDPSLQLVRFEGAGGKHIGALVGYAAHTTVLGARNLEFSAEYPGALERNLEKAWGGTVFFFSGPVGSMSHKGGEGEGFAKVEFIGNGLAERALGLVEEPGLQSASGELAFRSERISVLLPPVQYRVSDNLRLSPVLCRFGLDFERRASIQVLRLGSLVMVGVPCELSGELAVRLYEKASEKGLHLVVTPFNGYYAGYVVPDEFYGLNKYESRSMNFLGPYAGDYFLKAIEAIIERT